MLPFVYNKKVILKIVYYGPGFAGKTKNLETVSQKYPKPNRGADFAYVATELDRTLSIDFEPIGVVAGKSAKLCLSAVPGQVFYNCSLILILQKVDGIIFVADSQKEKMSENKKSLQNLRDNLQENGMDIVKIPMVMQWNKRDLTNVVDVIEMEKELNPLSLPSFEATAITGDGVFPCLKKLTTMILQSKYEEARNNRPG